MTHASSLLNSINGVTQSLSFPQASLYNLGMFSNSLFMSYTVTFATGKNNILRTSVKYWKVGDHGMSMSPLVTMALCIISN